MLDTSALSCWIQGFVSIRAWAGVARLRGLTLLVPSLARVEILTLHPDAAEAVEELASHPHVLLTELSDADRNAVVGLLAASGTCDVLGGWIVHVCRSRGWPALSLDSGRLHRLDPDLEIDLL